MKRHTVKLHTRVSSKGRVSVIAPYRRGDFLESDAPRPNVHLFTRLSGRGVRWSDYYDSKQWRTIAFNVTPKNTKRFGLEPGAIYIVQASSPGPTRRETLHERMADTMSHEGLHKTLEHLEGLPASYALDRVYYKRHGPAPGGV